MYTKILFPSKEMLIFFIAYNSIYQELQSISQIARCCNVKLSLKKLLSPHSNLIDRCIYFFTFVVYL